MDWWQAIILGFVQGITEFLPVSSSGHLMIVQDLMFGKEAADFLLFDLLLHTATLGAILLAFFKDIIKLFKPPFKTLGLLALATVPGGIAGVLISVIVPDMTVFMPCLWLFFLATAILLFTAERMAKTSAGIKAAAAPAKNGKSRDGMPESGTAKDETIKKSGKKSALKSFFMPVETEKGELLKGFTLKNALGMGFMQALAPLPGISRSGITLVGGVMTGGKREDVAKFSFFMSVPLILAATAMELFDLTKPEGLSTAALIPWYGYALAMLTAFIVAFCAIKLMLRLIAKTNYKWFSLYLVLMSAFTFFYYFIPSLS